MIYFAERDGLIKIGCSESPRKRAREQHARLLACIPGRYEAEREHHRRFQGSRCRGEWFYPTLDLLAYVSTLPMLRNVADPDAYVLTAGQVADYFQVCVATVLRWARRGLIPSTALPSGRLRFARWQIEAFITENTHPVLEAAS